MIAHARALWGSWWWLPALPWAAYAAALAAQGHARWDHFAIAGLAGTVAYTNPRTRRFFLHALPFFLLFLVYDSMRWWRSAGLEPGSVLGCSLRDLDLTLFGVRDGARLLTPNELLARVRHPALDLICAIPYGAYIPILVGHWIYLYFHDFSAARRFAWTALAAHLVGFATYRLLPAAPPWYVAAHGCVVDLGAQSSPAALARVDAMLGVTYFHDLYTRGATVYGALPSLHVTYPLYGLFATWSRSGTASRAIQLAYAGVMPFAAVYLNHHWVVDVLLGGAYAVAAYLVVRRLLPDDAAAPEPERAEGRLGDALVAPEVTSRAG